MESFPFSIEFIHKLRDAAISCELANERTALLAGISSIFVTGLSTKDRPSFQLLEDLNALNTVKLIEGEPIPMKVWLTNAYACAHPRAEAEVFLYALRVFQEPETQDKDDAKDYIDEPSVWLVYTYLLSVVAILGVLFWNLFWS